MHHGFAAPARPLSNCYQRCDTHLATKGYMIANSSKACNGALCGHDHVFTNDCVMAHVNQVVYPGILLIMVDHSSWTDKAAFIQSYPIFDNRMG